MQNKKNFVKSEYKKEKEYNRKCELFLSIFAIICATIVIVGVYQLIK